MDKKEIMQIGDIKATGNTWKLILMRLVSGIISYFIVIISLLTFKIKYFDVIIFMYMGLFNFFEIGIKSTCLNYVRGETEGVDLSDIFYALKTNQIRFSCIQQAVCLWRYLKVVLCVMGYSIQCRPSQRRKLLTLGHSPVL